MSSPSRTRWRHVLPWIVSVGLLVYVFGWATDWARLREADPDFVVLMPCGFDLKRTLADLPSLRAREGWAELKAVRNGRVFATDGNQYFNRPGPRLVESLEILAEILRPPAQPRHRGTGWLPVS